MFYYYGRKKKVSKYYPEARYDTIIEPFAGSAAYSLRGDNWKKNIVLVEKDLQVYEVWDWLINTCSLDEARKLPELKIGEKSSEFLHIIHAASKMSFTYKTIKVTEVLQRNWNVTRRVILQDLYKVKHWSVVHGDYTEAPNIEATWFVDPPYQGAAGTGYRHSSKLICYEQLGKWCCERKGQIICCEGPDATWLPFEPLVELVGIAGKKSKEMIFTRDSKICQG